MENVNLLVQLSIKFFPNFFLGITVVEHFQEEKFTSNLKIYTINKVNCQIFRLLLSISIVKYLIPQKSTLFTKL